MKQNVKTKRLVIISLLAAMGFTLTIISTMFSPMISFLQYDPKDVVFMLGGMAFGPLSTIAMSITVSFIEMITISRDGPIGFLMNVLASVSFITTATIIYRKNYTTKNLVIGLIVGSLLTTAVMVAWNYIVTPIYLQIPREDVVGLLTPIIIPFNLIKSAINSAVIVLVQKPVLRVFKQYKYIDRDIQSEKSSTIVVATLVMVSSIILVFLINSI